MKFIVPAHENAPNINLKFNKNQPSKIFKYHTAEGKIAFYVCRWDKVEGDETKPKKILPYIYAEIENGKFDYVSKWQESGRVLYNLPEIIANPEKPVLIVEGEKTAEAGKILFPNFVVTCTSGGSNQVNKSDFSPLASKVVYISPDADEAGKKYQKSIIELLKLGGSKDIYLLDTYAIAKLCGLENTPEGFDLADVFELGITAETLENNFGGISKKYESELSEIEQKIQKTTNKEELYELAKDLYKNQEMQTSLKHAYYKEISKRMDTKINLLIADISEGKNEGYFKSELDIAREVISEFGDNNLLFCKGSFYVFYEQKPCCWYRVDDRIIKQKIQEILPSDKVSKSMVDSITELCKNYIFLLEHEFDRDKDSISVLNGRLVFDGTNWQLKPHEKNSYNLAYIPIEYNPDALAPRFEKFLDDVFIHDVDKGNKKILILEAIGYTLTKKTNFEKAFFLTGSGANGKSVLLKLLQALIGSNNASAVQLSQIGNKFQRAHLLGKLANIVTETTEGEKLPDAEIKAIISGEKITVENKFQPPFDFEPYCTLWFATNHLPTNKDHSDAIYRRSIIIPFNRKFSEQEQDKNLLHKLKDELAGILNLSLIAFAGVLQRRVFTEPESCKVISNQWREDNDHIAQFVEEKCEVSSVARIESSKLYEAYKIWCNENGITSKCARNSFTSRLRKFSVEPEKGAGGIRFLSGISLKSGTGGTQF